MIEGIYFFGDQIRWNLGWPNPNPAGLFVAMCLMLMLFGNCFLWHKRRRVGWSLFVACLCAEGVLWFLLCKTYSRGALLAALVGVCLFYGALLWRSRGVWLWRPLVGSAFLRLGIVLGLLWLTGFLGRIEPGFVAEDASVGNRAVLWQGGITMIQYHPFKGWGVGESGAQYMHWFQAVDASERYAGMVNSYLHVAVERGLPILGGLLFGFLWMVFWGLISLFCSFKREATGLDKLEVLVLCGVSTLVVFLVGNLFNTLWVFPRLWVPVGIAAGLCLLSFRGQSKWLMLRLAALCALLFAITLCAMLYSASLFFAKQMDCTMELQPGVVTLQSKASEGASRQSISMLMDTEVFGLDYGKEARRLALALPNSEVHVLTEPDASQWATVLKSTAHTLLLSGDNWPSEAPELKTFCRVIWLHPAGTVPVVLKQEGVSYKALVLPVLDVKGNHRAWRKFAEVSGFKVSSSGSIGQDIRANWPGCVLDWLEPDE